MLLIYVILFAINLILLIVSSPFALIEKVVDILSDSYMGYMFKIKFIIPAFIVSYYLSYVVIYLFHGDPYTIGEIFMGPVIIFSRVHSMDVLKQVLTTGFIPALVIFVSLYILKILCFHIGQHLPYITIGGDIFTKTLSNLKKYKKLIGYGGDYKKHMVRKVKNYKNNPRYVD